MRPEFTPEERAILAIAQKDLPATLTPYADMAAVCGISEEEVLALLRKLKASGAIRRFGASIRHQRSGWSHNAMVAWAATEEEADLYGPQVAGNPHISHAYYRPAKTLDWPYALYTMAHGRSEEEVETVVKELAQIWPMRPYAILRTNRELKKTSMIYFS